MLWPRIVFHPIIFFRFQFDRLCFPACPKSILLFLVSTTALSLDFDRFENLFAGRRGRKAVRRSDLFLRHQTSTENIKFGCFQA